MQCGLAVAHAGFQTGHIYHDLSWWVMEILFKLHLCQQEGHSKNAKRR